MGDLEQLKEDLQYFSEWDVPVYLRTKGGGTKRGKVVESSADFFMFEDSLAGIEPIFFIEVIYYEPLEMRFEVDETGNG